MTQLELPPISFARYLDLLKRRRWQVLPVSILGLLVGAIVAFLIPRYYVCQTSILFRGKVLGAEEGRPRDPMAALVDGAANSIRYSVAAALDELGWPEMAGTPEQRRAVIRDVRDRVRIEDLGPETERRMSTNLRIVYKDTDPYRAKEFTDQLRDTWIAEEQRGMRERADAQLRAKQGEIQMAQNVLDLAQLELANYARQHKLNPLDFVGKKDGVLTDTSRELSAVAGRIATAEADRSGYEAAIAMRQEQLAKTSPKVTRTTPPNIPQAIQDKIDAAMVELLLATRGLKDLNESHPDYPTKLQQQKRAQEELAALREAVGGPAASREVDNPAIPLLTQQIDDLKAKLAATESALVPLRARRAELEEDIRRLPPILADYRVYQDALEKAKADVDHLVAERRTMRTQRQELLEAQPYEVKEYAQVPPRPTEPNITLVALAGSAVGLAFAIGLVLLIDILQTTFKTPDDVERLLSLPVLGGMSHLMTAERRQHLHSRRTKVGVVAGVFLVLTLSLVTIYYVDKTRLPPMVRDTLDLLLGPAGAATAPK